jgi:hypothetical protein
LPVGATRRVARGPAAFYGSQAESLGKGLYLAEPSKVVYRAKDGTDEKVFDALEWLAAMCSHIPDRGEQMVRYYGYYSNVSRGKRRETEDDGVPCILEADKSSKE